VVSLEKIILLPLAVVFGGLAILFAIAGEWKVVGGVAVLGVVVAAPILLVLLVVRRMRQARQIRNEQREYREGLIARADQQHGSMMGGVSDAGVFGAFTRHSFRRRARIAPHPGAKTGATDYCCGRSMAPMTSALSRPLERSKCP
jgi:hypothetical protein